MSSSFGGSNKQEVELNITPIIDCFTVLITFLLASASFLSIGFFEASTPGGASDPAATEPDTEAVMKLKPNHMAELKLKGKRNLVVSYNLSKKEDLDQMDAQIKKIEEEKLNLSSILLTADDDVEYKALAEVMEHLNKSPYPVIVGEF